MWFLILCAAMCLYILYCLKIKKPFIQYGAQDTPIFYSYRLFTFSSGWSVNVHRVVAPDPAGRFHGHEGLNYRIILKGGYVEERYRPELGHWRHVVRPGTISKITPHLIHRFDRLLNGSESVTLWLKGPKTHPLRLYGDGWPVEQEVSNA